MKFKTHREIVYWLFRFFCLILSVLPRRLALLLGEKLGLISFWFLPRERKKALANLDLVFGKLKSDEEKKRIVLQVFKNLGKDAAEIIKFPVTSRHGIDKTIQIQGREKIDSVLKKGKGGIFLTAHFGNWELLAAYFASKGYPVNVLAQKLYYTKIDSFLSYLRAKMKVNVISRTDSLRGIIRCLKNNEFVGILSDQNTGKKGVWVDFMGKNAFTPTGVVSIACKTGASILPGFIRWQEGNRHLIVIEDPIELSFSDDKESDLLENIAKCNKIIGSYIKKYPTEWVWFHQRWKIPDSQEKKHAGRDNLVYQEISAYR